MKEKIKKIIIDSLKELGYLVPEGFVIECPENDIFGDYATNVALQLKNQTSKIKNAVKKSKVDDYKNPKKVAQKIADKLKQKAKDLVEKVEVAGPGFINISIKKEVFVNQLKRLLTYEADYGKSTKLKGKKISVEYTDPNPFKEFHIGHLFSNVIGESLSRLLEFNGAKVWRGDFYGDVGMHVAKSVWGMLRLMKNEGLSLDALSKKSINERQEFLGRGYALGVKNYEESEKAKEEIKNLNFLVYVASQRILEKEKHWQPIVDYRRFIKAKEEKLEEVQRLYEAGLRWSLEYFEGIYKRLGTKFDGYYPESWTGELGMELVKEGLKKGVLEKSNGAVIYRGEQDGLHTRVFVNKMGLPTYEAKDLGLAQAKYDDFKYDLSINVFGKEIDEYYKVVKKVLEKIKPSLGTKAMHIAHGMVNLPEGKMSSRYGNVITCEWLLDEVKKRVLKLMKGASFSDKDREVVAEQVAVGAVRYALLRSSPGRNVVFDFGSSVSLEGDSGPYIQYTFARAQSVLRKSKVQLEGRDYQLNKEELGVLRQLVKFEDVVIDAAGDYAPNKVCNYLYELAQKFNSFYNECSILNTKDEKQSQLRLGLTAAVAQVIKNGLYLLGIEAPFKM